MKKAFILIISFYFTLIPISILQSCVSKYDASICCVFFKNVILENDSGDLIFEIGANDNCKCSINKLKIDLIESCFATERCVNWQNSLDKSTFSLKFDYNLIIDNDTLPENINILKIDKITNYILIDVKDNCSLVLVTIRIYNEVVKNIKFEDRIYNITFSCSTSDNKHFEDTIEHRFEK